MILNLIKNFDEGGKIRTNIVQVDAEKYLNQKYQKLGPTCRQANTCLLRKARLSDSRDDGVPW